jgi:hypothetical protein
MEATIGERRMRNEIENEKQNKARETKEDEKGQSRANENEDSDAETREGKTNRLTKCRENEVAKGKKKE